MDSRVSCPDLRPSTAAAGPPVLRSADAHRLAGLVRDGKPQGPVTVVVVPSVTLDPAELRRIPGSVHFEHRLLFTLRYLRDPQVRVVYVTSGPLERAAVDYTLRILCGAQADAAAARLTLIDCDDAGDDAVALTHRVLARQAVQERILACPDVPDRAYLLTFTTTPAERFLADRLGLPLYGCDPELAPLGTKTGSRRLFAEAGVPVAEGRDGIRNRAGLVAALAGLVPPGAGPASVVVKLDDSFAGLGNAVVALPAVPPTADFDWYERQVVAGVCFADGELTWPRFLDAVDRRGCVVERLVESPARLAPSAQLEIGPDGGVRVVSTHSQTLSGTLGHTFVGCAFPAPEPVRSRLVEYAGRAGRALAARGVLGHLSIDFLVGEGDAVLALETNLRMGGATAPFALLEGLLAGRCEARDGRYLHPDGDERCYVASDRVHRPALEGRTAAEAITAVERSGLAFRPDSGTGVALFALGAVGEFGKLGILAVERSAAKAEELFDAALEALDGVTRPH